MDTTSSVASVAPIPLLRPPPYELFFAPLEVVLSPEEFENVRFAYLISKYGHAKQVRDGGGRYFDHPKGMAWCYIHELGGRDVRVIIDCFLHDTAEDAYLLSQYRAARNFGEDIARDRRALTKLPKGKETTEQYLLRVIARGPCVILTKLLDRLNNIRSLAACTPEKQRRQVEETKKFHLPMLLDALRNCGDPAWSQYTDKLDQMFREALAPYWSLAP